jgi:uncharacterized protein YjiK
MLYRNLIIYLSAFANILAIQGCATNKNKVAFSPKEYDLNRPLVLYLNDALSEISGIYFYPKDTSVFAISDGSGYLFKIHLGKNIFTQRWKFDKTFDFEDLVYKDSAFYVLESNGDIHTLKFSPKGDTITTQTTLFAEDHKNKNDFESLYYDPVRKSFILICKDCQSDKKNVVTARAYHPENNTFTPSAFTINVDLIAKKTGLKKLKFKPSAATINPLTGDLWILASANMLLVVTDKNGNCKAAYHLNPAIFTQPEGITFTQSGNLIISNEAGTKYNSPTLLIFKRKTLS